VDRLSQILSRERELLELLATASGDAERIRSSLKMIELLRAVLADVIAEQVGLAPNPSLAALAAAAPDGWRRDLLQHREALRAMLRAREPSGPGTAGPPASPAPHPSLVDFLR
jgi:hypothetical protein